MNTTFHDLSQLHIDIPVEGYIWDSEEEYPKVYRNGKVNFSKWINNNNSYIVEALLHSIDKKHSWHIRHNGNYVITQHNLEECTAKEQLKEVKFIQHRLNPKDTKKDNRISKLIFKQLWQLEEDPNCHDMEVFKMKALIFTGFDNLENDKKND